MSDQSQRCISHFLSFREIKCFGTFPYKSTRKQTWPLKKTLTNLMKHNSKMIYTPHLECHYHFIIEEQMLKFFYQLWARWPSCSCDKEHLKKLVSPNHGVSLSNLASMCTIALKKKKIPENMNDLWTNVKQWPWTLLLKIFKNAFSWLINQVFHHTLQQFQRNLMFQHFSI